MMKLPSNYNAFFVHSHDDLESLHVVLAEMKDVVGFGHLFVQDRHIVALCTKEFARAFGDYVADFYGGDMWMTDYELNAKRLPPVTSKKTIKISVPHHLTSIYAKAQIRSMITSIGKFIPITEDKIRLPLKDGKHRGFGFLEFSNADTEAVALTKMFLSTYLYTDADGVELNHGKVVTHWYEERTAIENQETVPSKRRDHKKLSK